jgi:hypothetical protein
MTSESPIFTTATVPTNYSINNLGTNSTLLIPANPGRRWVCIQNISSVNVWINFGSAATAGYGSYLLLPNGVGLFQQECNSYLTSAIYAIAASGGSNSITAKDI